MADQDVRVESPDRDGAADGTAYDFLRGGGELGALMRGKDWSETPFGPLEGWPQSLRSAVSIMLNSRYPIALYWGQELALLYNDAWSPIPGGKHPWALGRPGKEVWPEIWDRIGPLYDNVRRTGEGVWQEDELLPMFRHGYLEECYYNFTFSPVWGDAGSIDGIFNAVIETTDRVLSERRLRTLSKMGRPADPALSVDAACQTIVETLGENKIDVPFALIYLRKEDQARLVGIVGVEAGATVAPAVLAMDRKNTIWPLRAAEAAGTAIISPIDDLELSGAVWPEPVSQAITLPLNLAGEQGAASFLVCGANPRLRIDTNYQSFFEVAAGHVANAMAAARAYEQERQRAEALAELDRTKTAFFSNVSHEFRTPLTLLLGPLEEILNKADSDVVPDNRALVDVAHRNGLRLLRLVNALLDFSRIEAGRTNAVYRRTDLASFTAELASGFRSISEKAGLGFTIEAPPLAKAIYVDPAMWEKIVLNLLSNAFKFTFEGEIRVALTETPEGARLTVRDTGIGIDSEELPKLFERFHRVEGAKGRSFEGSGIGLALVEELAELHGGEVSAESEPGKGSAFHVTIPFGRDHLPAEQIADGEGRPSIAGSAPFIEEASRWLPEHPGRAAANEDLRRSDGRPRIVLADDNADMRSYIQRLLADDYIVEAVGDGEAALGAIRREPPDLVLTDVMMPKLDGFGLVKAIRGDESLVGLPVVMLSARAGEEAEISGLAAGADDYLVKPFSARELLARVSSTIGAAKARRRAESALQRLNAQLALETERMSRLVREAPSLMFLLTGPELRFEFANEAYRALTGNRELIGKRVRDVFPELEEQGFLRLLDEVYRTGQAYRATAAKVSFPRSEGGEIEDIFVDFVFQPVRNADDDVTGIFVQANDVTEHKRTERLRGLQNRILELAIEDCSLANALEQLILAVEAYSSSGMLGSVLLLDSAAHRLRHGAAPNLPSNYNEAIDGIEIGPNVGSCGTAASTGSPVYVSDIGSDPLWADFRELALSHGLRACWSTPIRSNQGKVLGTFAIYYPEPRSPAEDDLELIDFVSRSVSLIIQRKEAERRLREDTRILETLHRTGAAVAAELDLESVVQLVTDSGVELTGAEFGAFFYNVVDRRGESYMLYTLSGVDRSAFEKFPMPRNTAIFGPTFAGEGIVRSDDITNDPRYGKNPPYHGMPEGHLPVTSYLAVPVKGRAGDVIGGLFFGHSKPGQFEERHEILMEGIAAQAAIAIDNARLFGEAQGEIERRHEAEEALRTLNATLESRVVEEIERRAKAEDALRQSQKMETVGQLSGGIAHDFNNLLQIIHGNLTLLQGAIPADEPKWQRSIVNALTGTERAAALTQRLLAFSRRQPLDARPVDINQMIADMIELLHRTLGETIVIETRLASDVPTALVDANQLENAILNLAINARDAMPRGGVLEISTDIAELDSAAAAANADASPGRYVRITVGDTGEGMSPEVLSRAVEPFFSTKEVGQGTGLGLSMVYGFAKQSGGHLVVNSVESEGTTIELYVPCSSEVAEPRADKRERSELPAGKGERILLCEDDPDVRRFSSETLADLGYEVIEAHDADSALHALRNSKPIDLLFTDIVLPGGRNGADLAREARLLQADLKVLFATGYARSALEERQDRGSGLALLLKPFGVEELATKLRTMLDT